MAHSNRHTGLTWLALATTVLVIGQNLVDAQNTGSMVTMTVTITSGTPPFTYTWAKNGSAIPGATTVSSAMSNSYVIPYAQVADGAAYAATVSNSAGPVTANTSFVVSAIPVNDAFANPRIIAGLMAIARGTNVSATKEAGEPNHAGNAGGSSVWWKWTAPQSTLIKVDTVGSNFDTLLGVYTGSLVSALVPIASDDNGSGDAIGTSSLSFQAVSGTTYYIAVDGKNGVTGAINLQLTNQSDFLPAYPILTLAGMAGFASTTDGTGTAARFHNPAGIAIDASGNFYVADRLNHTIRMITSAGVVTTVAGTAGTAGSANGTGTAAQFNNPTGVAVDSSGNIYVADSGNHTIRMIAPGGVVTTLAGTAGSLGSLDGLGSAARFNNPSGIAVDAYGTLYVADSGNYSIRTIAPGGSVTTLAGISGVPGSSDGTGSAARFNNPTGVAVDSASNVYVADYGNNTIRRIAPGGVVTTLAGSAGLTGTSDGLGSAARFNAPAGVGVDAAGNVYVADYGNHTIRFITTLGKVSTIAGTASTPGSVNGTGLSAQFYNPRGVVVDPTGNIYIADYSNHMIRKSALVTATPAITNQPSGQTGTVGGSVTLSATGTSWLAAALQWYHNGVLLSNGVQSDGSTISGATSSMLTLTNLQLADAGTYTLVATNSSGSVTSTTTSINIGPVITGQTISQAVLPHASATFTVTVTGAPAAAYLWQRLPAGSSTWASLSDNTTYTGSLTATLTVSGTTLAMNGDQFQCIATNVVGPATSVPAPLSLRTDDMNGDGWSDILWQCVTTNTTGNAGDRTIWLTTPTTTSNGAILAKPYLANVNPVWRIAGTGDFNGDGQTDILWENTVTGDHTVWFMNGPIFTGNSAYLAYVPTNWHVAAVADFNGDGHPDILWEDTTTTSATSGLRSVWFMNGTTIAGFSAPFFVDPGMHIAGAADVNGDGQPDIFFECTTATTDGTMLVPGDRTIDLMNGATVSNYFLFAIVDPAWRIAAVADYDGDGQTDVLWEKTTTGDHAFWLMDPVFANWSVYPKYGVLGTPYFTLQDPGWRVAP